MDIETFLGEPKTLDQWLTECVKNPGQGYYLLYKDATGEVQPSLATLMYPVTGDTSDLTDEEFDEYDSSIHEGGYSSFLNLDQLEDVISNLEMQKGDYSRQELFHAVDFYFSRDAFIVIENG